MFSDSLLPVIKENLVHSPMAGFLNRHEWLRSWNIEGMPVLVMTWNILLAVSVPLLALLMLNHFSKKRPSSATGWLSFAVSFLVWLFLYPNAMYLITESRRNVLYCSSKVAYLADPARFGMTMFIFAYAFVGWVCFAIAMVHMRVLFQHLFGKTIGIVTTLLLVPVGTLGCFLGLFNRWNSWEIIPHFAAIFSDALSHLTDPVRRNTFLYCTGVFGFLYLLGEYCLSRRLHGSSNQAMSE